MKLSFFRKQIGLTQIEFGARIASRQAQVSQWEKGYIIPSVKLIRRINAVFANELKDCAIEKFYQYDFGDAIYDHEDAKDTKE